MIDKDTEIKPGMVVLHDDGLRYRVDALGNSTAGYEVTHKVGAATIHYTQLEAGSFPVGKAWDKPVDEFRQYFTIIDETPTT